MVHVSFLFPFLVIFSIKYSFPISASGERSDEIPPDTECPDSARVPTQERGRNKMIYIIRETDLF